MQLRPFLVRIADAIRGKEGSTATIPAADFASRIANLPSGEDEIDGLVEGTLTEFTNNRVITIKEYLFRRGDSVFDKLKSVHCENVEKVSVGAFANCQKLSSVYLPKCLIIESEAFLHAFPPDEPRQFSFPQCLSIGSYAFADSYLSSLDIKGCDDYGSGTISANAFSNSKLERLVLRSEVGAPFLSNTSAFARTPVEEGTGYIYVPRSLVDTYKTATNWSIYANQIRALEDYTIDGTTTGVLDPSKI